MADELCVPESQPVEKLSNGFVKLFEKDFSLVGQSLKEAL